MNAWSILSRVRAWLGSRLSSTLPSRRWRIAGGVSVILVVALLIASLFILRQQRLAGTASVPADVCAPSATIVPMVPPGVTLPVNIPAGEPRVVATVNGYPLCAEGLELRVQGTLANNRKMLQQLQTMQSLPPGSSMANLVAILKETPNQVRHDALTHMIQERLLVQEGKRLGLTASLADARAMARQTMERLRSLPPTDPSRVAFETYLRANHLTDQTYQTDPRILQGYVQTLTMAAVRQYIVKRGVPPDESPETAINAYIQHLWQTGHVHVYLPAKLGW
jgi:SurA-like protein